METQKNILECPFRKLDDQTIIFNIFSRLPISTILHNNKYVCKEWHRLTNELQKSEFYKIQLQEDAKDILINLFFFLPIRSLLLYHPICVNWHRIGHNKSFRIKHHSQSIQNHKNQLLKLTQDAHDKTKLPESNYDPSFITFDNIQWRTNLYYEKGGGKMMDCDSSWEVYIRDAVSLYPFKPVGPCKGFICICEAEYCDPICIWNFFTEAHIMLPTRPIIYADDDIVSGFGFATESEKYKVVRMEPECLNFRDCKLHAEIHTVGTDAWRMIGPAPRLSSSPDPFGVLVNGALHWIARCLQSNNVDILALDLETEEFKMVPAPDFGEERRDCNFILFNLREHLAVVLVSRGWIIEVWELVSHELQPRWSKLDKQQDLAPLDVEWI